MENEKREVEVRTKDVFNTDTYRHDGGVVLDIIKRKPFHKGWFGNFVPVYVRYEKKEYLLHSDNGDVSDPFRGGDIGLFYIEV